MLACLNTVQPNKACLIITFITKTAEIDPLRYRIPDFDTFWLYHLSPDSGCQFSRSLPAHVERTWSCEPFGETPTAMFSECQIRRKRSGVARRVPESASSSLWRHLLDRNVFRITRQQRTRQSQPKALWNFIPIFGSNASETCPVPPNPFTKFLRLVAFCRVFNR